MYTVKERKEYNERRDRACQRLGITKNEYNWLRRKGAELHKIYEIDCNGGIDTPEDYDRLTGSIEAVIDKKAQGLGLTIHYQTDPRGATIYADRQPIPENNYTQAVCIY